MPGRRISSAGSYQRIGPDARGHREV